MSLHSFLRWAGSKRSSLPALALHFPHQPARYLEPFCGSAALFFHLHPQGAVLSDINHALISFYKTVKAEPAEVYELATSYPRTERAYYKLREKFNSETDRITRAALFYYLNKNCFNGLYRTSRVGNFNVPFSPSRTGEYPEKLQFVATAKSLKQTRFECCDFEKAIRKHCKAGDFVFLDPPYSNAKRYPFREYYPGCFSQNDLDRLRGVLEFIQAKKAHFVLTFSNRLTLDCSTYGWNRYTVRTRRNISGFSDARKYVRDIVVTNLRADK